MAKIPDSHADLIGAPHFAHLATVNADGSPQTSVIWVQRDGDDVLFTTNGNRKMRNMRRDPRVALSIHDEKNPYRYIELRGRAQMTPRDSYDFLDGLTKQYLALDEYPEKDDAGGGVLVRVSVDHVVTFDWQPPAGVPVAGE